MKDFHITGAMIAVFYRKSRNHGSNNTIEGMMGSLIILANVKATARDDEFVK